MQLSWKENKKLRWVGFAVLGVIFAIVILYVVAGYRYSQLCGVPRSSCAEHLQSGCKLDGTYSLQVGPRVIKATCDMRVDGGGWTLVLNYLHKGGSDASPIKAFPQPDRLPLEGSERLGLSEVGSEHWGHAAPPLLAQLSFSSMRFKCSSSAHKRVVDFVLSSKNCLDYFRSGAGGCFRDPAALETFKKDVRLLVGHTANLPLAADLVWFDQKEFALTAYPFYKNWNFHWAIGTEGDRWECDDRDLGGKQDTRHQVWVR